MHAGRTARWYCESCLPELSQVWAEGLVPCPLCCGFKVPEEKTEEVPS